MQAHRASLEMCVLGTSCWLYYGPLKLTYNDEISRYGVSLARKTHLAKIFNLQIFFRDFLSKDSFSLFLCI